MKSLDLLTDLRPWRAGDTIHVAEDLAKQLVASGEARNMRAFAPTGGEQNDDASKGGYKTKVVRARQ